MNENMNIKKFEEYNKINELFIHKNKRIKTLDNKFFILYKKDLWIFDENEWIKKKIYNVLNKAYGKIIASDSLEDTLIEIQESFYDILCGYIKNKTIFLKISGDFRHSEHSDDLFKLEKELKMPIKLNYHTGIHLEVEEELDINTEKKKLQNRTFYHGTCLKFLNKILKIGITPTKHSNYNIINHIDKIFFTLNLEKANLHAFNSSKKNNSFPIIISFNVPDINKLIPDFDLAIDAYGSNSEVSKTSNYHKFNNTTNSKMNYNKDITKKIGIFGYKGRIPPSHINDIWIDLHTYSQYIEVFLSDENIEYDNDIWSDFNNVKNWSEISKDDILNKITEIQDNYEDGY